MSGAIAGIVGGLLGIGGGSLTVPALLLVGFPEAHIMHIAIGTSLSAMVVSTAASAYWIWMKKLNSELSILSLYMIGSSYPPSFTLKKRSIIL